ncbi:MAG TPA: amidohydrolase family protein [bacterium]|nr:amidohydrolase family protein [bacterium]
MDTEEQEFSNLRPKGKPLTELHLHAGAGLPTSTMWSIAHDQGIRLPFKNYWDFKDFITITRDRMMNLDSFLHSKLNPFHWCEVIQSSPEAMERTIYEIAAKAYRSSNVTKIEIRFTPMKRNRSGERDLDHIIMSALHGLDKVMLEYPVRVGLIFCLEKKFSKNLNKITVEKAIKYKERGVVGIDLAGYDSGNDFHADDMADIFKMAKDAGLGITIHAGESKETLTVTDAILKLGADRIGHGIQCIHNQEEMALIREKGVTLEFCPTSNLILGLADGIPGLRRIASTFVKNNLKFTINTDDPVFFQTNLSMENKFVLDNKILTKSQLNRCIAWADQASFIDY